MANCAKVSLTGRLIKDAEKKSWNNKEYVTFTVAVNTTKKEGDKYISDLYNVNAWGQVGEFILPRVKKGSLVQVYGDLVVKEYVKDEVKQKSLNVRATEVLPLSPVGKSNKEESSSSDDNDPF